MLLPSTLFSLETFKHDVSQYIAIKALFGWGRGGGGDVVNIKRREEVKVGVK
jgi:hypothetical protein